VTYFPCIEINCKHRSVLKESIEFGLALRDVARIPKTIGIVAVEIKAKPVRAVLQGRYLSSVVVDESAANPTHQSSLEKV
jgi:DNA-binding transcriptional regulator LsrR (DeoR family)